MNQIERDIFVLLDVTAVAQPIDYVQGTNAIPLIFHIRDYDIPVGSMARVYIKKPSTKAEYDNVTLNGNTVIVDIKDTMFLELGWNFLQISITHEEKTLVTFEYPVNVKRNNVAGELPESGNNSNFLDEYLKEIDQRIEETNTLSERAVEAAGQAGESAAEAGTYAEQAGEKAAEAADSAKLSKSWAVGDTGIRDGENTDNSKYYCNQSKNSSEISKTYLDLVEQAGNDAVEMVKNALDADAPEFMVDLYTGHLMYSECRFVFLVNIGNGHLEWGLAV